MRGRRPDNARPGSWRMIKRWLNRLETAELPRSRYLVHALVLLLALLAAAAGGHTRSESQLEALSYAFSLDAGSNYRAGYTHPVRNTSDYLVRAPSVETRLVNRPRHEVSFHFVREGETMAGLAERYGVDVETIAWANVLNLDEPLRDGQLLIVPPVKGVLHVVRVGDTIERIAERYEVDPQDIVDYNQLTDPSKLLVGERLVVPNGLITSERAQLAARGEERILPSSALQPASLPIAQPASAPESLEPESDEAVEEPAPASGPLTPWIYIVQEEDTVLELAIRFGISPETIVWANGLGSSAMITVGQELLMLPVSGVLHRVSEGDTLQYIADLYQADVAAIVEANHLEDASLLTPGEDLIIPGGQLPVPYFEEEDEVVYTEPTADAPVEPAPSQSPRSQPTPKPAPAPAPSGEGGWAAVSVASEFLGYPYVWGGTSPNVGFDCSGFVWYVYNRRLGIPLPRAMDGQWNSGYHVSYEELAPGDIVFFRNTYKLGLSHVGIYMGGGRYIHAASVGQGVIVSGMGESYWAARYAGAVRVIY